MQNHNNNRSSYKDLHPESKTLRESLPFTQISNNVINNIKNSDAFLVWCYLYSKPSNWKTIKQNIKNVYGFGDAKIKKIFSYLRRANLIEYVQNKCANGTYAHVQIQVLNGDKFDITQSWLDSAPLVQKPAPAVSCSNGNDELLNKDINKQRKEINTKRSSASSDAQNPVDDFFNEFWNVYPIKKNKKRTKQIWLKQKLNNKAQEIIEDINNRLAKDQQWTDPQFIPHPSTYLHNELWNDEIVTKSKSAKPSASEYHDNQKKIRDREIKAAEEKRKEIEESRLRRTENGTGRPKGLSRLLQDMGLS